MLVSSQLSLDLDPPKRWGGAQPGAGRPRGSRPRVLHRARHGVSQHQPMHVTLRMREGVPNLRTRRFIRAFRDTLQACSTRPGFRVVHYSIQKNHLHCVVEAASKEALANGMKSFGARVARAVNSVFGRKGPVLDGRYHSQPMKGPRQTRHALAYVLLNNRKHYAQCHKRNPPVEPVDGASSGDWFDGWKRFKPKRPKRPREVALPQCWLLTQGWRKFELIDPAEVPG